MGTFKAIIFTIVVGIAQCNRNNECVVYPRAGIDPRNGSDGVGDFTVKTSCKNGTVFWDYPTGKVMIHFPFGGTFSVCLVDHFSGNMVTTVDMSGYCYKVLPNISGTPTCVDSIDGEVAIQFQAPQEKHYTIVVYYYVDHHKGIQC